MAVLRGRLFGGLTLAWDKSPLPAIPGVTARSLLAYLLVHRDRPHTRDFLAGTFWPDQPDATARRRLSQALRRLVRRPHLARGRQTRLEGLGAARPDGRVCARPESG